MSMNKESLQVLHDKVVKFFTQDFKELFTSHINDNHTFLWTEGTYKLHKISGIDLKLIDFVLIGKNELGNIEKYDMFPASFEIEDKYKEIAEEILEEDKTIKCSFTNKSLYFKNPLNYKVHIEVVEKEPESTVVEKTEPKVYKAPNPKSYASIAQKVKDAPVPAPKTIIQKPKQLPEKTEVKEYTIPEDDNEIKIQQKKLKISQLELELQELEISKLKKKIEASKLEKELEELISSSKLVSSSKPVYDERPLSPEIVEIVQEFENSKQNWFDSIEPPAPKSKPATPKTE